jgi:hypothetical protein
MLKAGSYRRRRKKNIKTTWQQRAEPLNNGALARRASGAGALSRVF